MKLYKVTINVIGEVLDILPVTSTQPLEKPRGLDSELRRLVKGESGIIDGERLRNFVFPTDNYDVFISHSHNDLEIAKLFAAWLKEKYGLSVFLDSFVWSSADGLLREIDNQYCQQRNGLYSYHRRNYSTAHVHTMLSMSILEIIKNSSAGIFINSLHSIALHNLSNNNRAKTLSPWIYQEIMFMRLFADKKASTRMFSLENLNESLQITHMVDLSDFVPLTTDCLIRKFISQ
ncbi:toll/interleukin-1 receptor domain-containing protein [Hoylesella saccharolytica]|uniref:toll/interleukin-1 receptor domain-containing protein n=1 Tax=Hoylesella saccharolytica TaxID=633701 RepID=UPI00046F3AA8|nr:toll/interleukin-1 receptor domain-containing protein [Hoylesella saccharolytica]